MFSSSGGIKIFFSIANFFNATYFDRIKSISSLILMLSSFIDSISRHSYKKNYKWKFSCSKEKFTLSTWLFSLSRSSFCSILLMRHDAAYPRFFNVLLRCFILTIWSRFNPRNLRVRLRSRTEIETNSSSEISGNGQGDRGA